MPPLDPHARRFVAMLAAGGKANLREQTVAGRRAALAELLKLGGPALPMHRIDDLTVPGADGPLPTRLYVPTESLSDPAPGLVYFHGGGLVAGSLDTHDGIARALASAGACRVASIGYRLAPEHPFPAALDDAFAAVNHLAAHAQALGIDAARLGICGDSAGAMLAVVTCQRLAAVAGFRPAVQLLLCPILDYGPDANSQRDFSSGDPVDEHTLEHDIVHYLGAGTPRDDPRLSPLSGANVAALPPAIIHTAECDPLLADGRQYRNQLHEAGVTVIYRCHPGMIHLFYGLGGVIPYARVAMAAIGDDLCTLWRERSPGLHATIVASDGEDTLT